MALTENVGGSGAFKATTLGTSQNYSLSAATSPLILTPPAGKAIRLDRLISESQIIDVTVTLGSQDVINGNLDNLTSPDGNFNIACPSTDTGNASVQHCGVKNALLALDKDQSISISTTSASPVLIYYSISYGDLA